MKRFINALIYLNIFFLSLVSVSILKAEDRPEKPKNFRVEQIETNNNRITLKLLWNASDDDDDDKPTFYFIYKADKSTEDLDDFEYHAFVKVSGNKNNYMYMIQNLEKGDYSFYITAVRFDHEEVIESEPTDIVKITLQKNYYVKIHSEPVTTAKVNRSYTYTVKAKTNADCDIRYSLKGEIPEGMEIDHETGKITWTPEETGNYSIKVRAELECDDDEYAEQTYEIRVKADNDYHLRFKSFVLLFASAGEELSYLLKAETNANCDIKYEFANDDHASSMVIDGDRLIWTPESKGIYLVRVRAYLECNTDIRASQYIIILVDEDKKDYLSITSRPEETAYVGEEFIYQLETETNADCDVMYGLGPNSPSGLTISESGKVSWTPTETGETEFTVKAWLSCNNSVVATQRVKIHVIDRQTGDSVCALISGHLTFNDSLLNVDGRIRAWRIDSTDNNTQKVYVADITDGSFALHVAEGTYVVRADVEGYRKAWFNNADNMADAMRIEAGCDDTVSIAIGMTEEEDDIFIYTVSGSVKSAIDDSGIHSYVEFIPVNWMYDDSEDKPNFKYIAETDIDGNYTIMLPNAFTYIAHAVPVDENSQYSDQYYDGVNDPLQSDLIYLTSDVDNINFLLGEKPDDNDNQNNDNGFAGRVTNSDGSAIQSRVIAYLVDPRDDINWSLNFIRVAETDANGHFSFSNLIPGKYILLSIPFDRTYVPGYYLEGTYVTLKWKDASRIEVGDEMLTATFQIMHEDRTEIRGIARVEGQITALRDKENVYEPISGVAVYLLNANNEVVSTTFTDRTGEYRFENVLPGDYRLLVDRVGYSPVDSRVKIDYEENYDVRVDMQLTPEEISGVEDNQTEIQSSLLVYPSPVENQATIQFQTSEAGRTELSLYSQVGGEIMRDVMEAVPGLNRYTLNAANLPSGVYVLRIQNGGSVSTINVNVIK